DLAYLTRVNLERGAKVIKTRANPRAGLPEQDPRELVYNQEQLSAVVKAAKGAGVLCHAYSAEGIDGAVRAGVQSIEHGVFVTESTIREMARRGTYFTPTMDAITSMATSTNPILAARGKEYTPILQAARCAPRRRRA
ncbi:MAG: amidohydrolase, partial [Pseudarthrobacter sp.]|nr:amidohydrolase [Pseudarthrobacter sp.]